MGDLFDGLLDLEEDYYKEGYAQGLAEGRASGRLEGRLFGFSTGFSTYLPAGEIHGHQSVWAARTSPSAPEKVQIKSERIVKNIRVLGETLGEIEVRNGDDETEVFQEDLKRARGKVRVLESMLGEKVEETKEEGKKGDMEDDVKIPIVKEI